MKIAITVFTLTAASMIAGCAVRPLPENYSGHTTVDIVNKIRCETRDAVRYLFRAQLERSAADRQILRELDNEESWDVANISRLSSNAKELVELYRGAVVGLEFEISGQEDNNFSVGAGLSDILPIRTSVWNLGGHVNRQRKNARRFYLDLTFQELALKSPNLADICKKFEPGPNHLHPITGSIGMQEMITTFFRLNRDGLLEVGSTTTGVNPASKRVAEMVDTITFTTSLQGDVNPVLTIKAVSGFGMTSGNFKISNTRVDTHKVTVGVSLPKIEKPVLAGQKSPARAVQTKTLQESAKENVRRAIRQSQDIDRQETLRKLEERLRTQ